MPPREAPLRGAPSLLRRLLLLVLGIVGAAWIGAAAWTYLDARHEVDELLDGHLAQAAALLIAQRVDGEDDDEAADVPPLHRYAPRVAFQLWHEGRLMLRSANAPLVPLGTQASGFDTVRHDGRAWRVFAARGGEQDVRVYVGERVDARDAILRAVMSGMARPLVVALPLLALLTGWAVYRGLAPLSALARELRAREPGSIAPLALAQPAAELLPAVTALNALFERIGGLLEAERRFTADAAHELRTPIAAIAAQAQVALGATNDAERRHALQATLAGCERAARLVDQMLTLARLENADAPPATRINVAALLRQVVAQLLPAAEARGQALELEAPPQLDAAMDETLLGVLARNLVDNALRYSPAGARVVVALAQDGTRWALTVDDAGPGLDDAARARLGERFFRVLGPEASGTGLGWSIVRRIASVLKLEVAVDRAPALGGLRVRVVGAGAA
jgi:two-component system, OmpR family, sensor histidine kinase QseC